MVWLGRRFAVVRHLRLFVALALSCLLIITSSCRPVQFKIKEAGVSQLVLVTANEPTTFNYPLIQSPYPIFPLLYEGLVTENALTGEFEPALAESWEISQDKRRITFTLRAGLKWSDGEPLTVDDVLFTFKDIYLNKKIPTAFRGFLQIGSAGTLPSVQKLDERRVEFTLPEPFAPFLKYIKELLILPAHALQESVLSIDDKGNPLFVYTWGTDTNPHKIIGNGSYKLASYTTGERVVLQRNPYYWRSDQRGNSQPYIDRIILQIITSTDNQLIKFRSRELDTIKVAPEAFSLLKREEKRGKFTVYNGLDPISSFVRFNLNQGRNAQGKPFVDPIKSRWFNTLAFREAVAYAIDRETMKNNIYWGLGEVQHSPLNVQSPYYLSAENGLKVYNYDPQKARQLLIRAGFKYNAENELLDWEGNRVQFTLLVKSEERSRIYAAVQIQQDLNKIGIKADLQVLNENTVLQKVYNSRDWECYVGATGFPGADFEPDLLSIFWRSGNSSVKQLTDWQREIDNLFAAGEKELDRTKRQKIYRRFQQIVAEQLPMFFLVHLPSFEAVRSRIHNLKFSPMQGAFWNIHEIRTDESTRRTSMIMPWSEKNN
ncbi:extracellular solute-binding protein [Scytonema sp. HK-05]|uniref:ABC transporter substrate-binding protein n=1 Tax=Scytonema sp. HK-05 TaxID=1137095 RepID=UPI000935DAE6|nr:ABC transporter substrate-binding protein [Scytonema sp. HK-05]OKH51439.1 peptide ABC transporter substrate-binding protein [Scytonema sp. HK-05]BAY48278.1 extracellular solute-binding protein [Scytonema sp. HK-05]